MMISKFHKLIQSRLLWGGFLVVIVFSFVIWGMVWPSDLDEMERVNAAGLLDGEPVSHGEFRSAYLSATMARALALGREVASTPENEAALRRLAWQRLASLKEAARLGIRATEDELVGAIRANFVDEQKRYSRARYDAFLQNLIRPMGFTEVHFEQHVREEIVLQKLGSLIGRQAFVTPLEIRRTFDTLLDSFTVDYAEIRLADIEPDVSVDESDARTLFDSDPALFRLPERREVVVAAFPIADYLDEDAEFTDEEIQDYYELNIEDFTREESGDDGSPRTVVTDLDEARDRIVSALRRDSALAKADAAAAELAFRSIPDRDGAIPDFAVEAEKAGRTVSALPPFSRFDAPMEDAGASFVAAAFELDLGAFDRISIPVAGQDQVYVIQLQAVHAPRLPSFEEVQDRVLDAARRQAVAGALADRAQAIREAALAGLSAGQRFADAVAPLGVEAATTEPFTGLSGSSSEDRIIQALVQAVVAYNPGEITEPIRSFNGLIVAHIARREPADPATFGAYRDEIAAAIRNRRAQNLFLDWQADLLAPGRFTDLQRQAVPDDGEEDGDFYDGEDLDPLESAPAADAASL